MAKGIARKELKKFANFLQVYELNKNIISASIDSGFVLKDFNNAIKGYYVYFLINPLTDKIFYIGKGKGKRALQHYKDYKNGREKNIFKYNEMRSFVKLGFKPIVKVVVDDITEDTAYKIETKLIKRLYCDLSNISQNENQPNLIKKGLKKILKHLPSYELWIFGIKTNKPLIYSILANKDYGKSLYKAAINCLDRLAKEYVYGE